MMLRGLSVNGQELVIGDCYYAMRFGRRYVSGHVYFYDRQLRLQATLVVPAAPTEIRRIDALDYSLSNYREAGSETVHAECASPTTVVQGL
jgi:hypothetical protein